VEVGRKIITSTYRLLKIIIILISKKTKYLYTAFLFSAAFSNAATTRYVGGKVEVIDPTLTGEESISLLEINSTIAPNRVVCTSRGSRTEIHDGSTILRLGANTVAKKEENGSYWIHSGSLLFCSTVPTTVRFSSLQSSATFEGRGTIILETTGNGGFKLIPLEAKGYFSTAKHGKKEARAGQLLFVVDNPSNFGDAYDIDLMLMLRSSLLINSFPDPLPTFELIGLAIYSQELKLKGKYDALIGNAPTKDTVQLWAFERGQGFSREKKPAKGKSPSQGKGFLGRLFGGKSKE
jgi:hypothetical protein